LHWSPQVETAPKNLVRRDSFNAHDFDRAIVDLSPDYVNICQMVSKLRKGEFTCSPFVVIIATAWERASPELSSRHSVAAQILFSFGRFQQTS
jgi:hypothetical protein